MGAGWLGVITILGFIILFAVLNLLEKGSVD